MMRDIHCSQCGKFLFSTNKSNDGAAAVEAEDHGFIAKMPFLYGTLGVFFFCDKECCKQWFREHISEQERKEGNDRLQKVKDSMEAGKPALIAGLQRIQSMFKGKNG